MEGIANYLDSLIGGVDLTFYSIVVGGVFWGLFVLRAWQDGAAYNNTLLDKSVGLIHFGSKALVITQLIKIGLKIWLMVATLGKSPFPAFFETLQFQAGMVRAVFAFGLVIFIGRVLKNDTRSKVNWLLALAIITPLVISGCLAGAWRQSSGRSRFFDDIDGCSSISGGTFGSVAFFNYWLYGD